MKCPWNAGRGSSKRSSGRGSVIVNQWCITLLFWWCAIALSACAARTVAYVPPPPAPVIYKPPQPPAPPPEKAIIADASWYGPGFEGRKTATGERFSSRKMTAAAKGIPLGSHVVITNLNNGRSATVRINDCGPYAKNRKIDLSKGAARKLGLIHDGVARVKIKVIKKPAEAPTCPSRI